MLSFSISFSNNTFFRRKDFSWSLTLCSAAFQMRWTLILGYQQWKRWICLFDLLRTLCWLVTNLIPCVLWVTIRRVSCLLVDSFRIQWFWQRSLVTSELKVTSFRVTWVCRSVGNLTPTLVQNLIFDSMNLLMQISFRVIVDHKRLCCNRLSVPELVTTHRLPFWTRVGSCFQLSLCCTNCYGPTPNGFIWLYVYFMLKMDECTVKDSFPLSCIDMVYDICCAKSSVWYISTFAIRMTTSTD
jgi:hypothetical protein